MFRRCEFLGTDPQCASNSSSSASAFFSVSSTSFWRRIRFPFFLALVVAVHVNNAYGELSKWGALLYLTGRVAYLPLYAFGVYLVRSLAWNVATAGILLLLVSALGR